MKKIFLFLTIAIFTLKGYSQILFEKGYYINNSNEKIECLIKNLDWRSNPTEFEFKTSEQQEPINITIKSVKEFGIYNFSKYIRATVKIDMSSENIDNLDYEKNPVMIEEQLFLKVLIEGKSNLYLFQNGDLQRFFYSKEKSNIEMLVYKKYLISESQIAKNNKFKQQLFNDLNCPEIERRELENLEYKKNSLIKFFIKYNKCNTADFVSYEEKVKKDLFNLTVRPYLRNSSLSISNASSNENVNFGNKSTIGLGVEAEFILPYNKNKWAIAIEPTYQSFKSEKTYDVDYTAGGKLTATIDYSSIEVPVSLRHYFFINNKSKFFINASYIFDFTFKSKIEFKRVDNSTYNSLEINSRNNSGFGLGYKLKDKYSIEMRYLTNRNILGNYLSWKSSYNPVFITFGYTLF